MGMNDRAEKNKEGTADGLLLEMRGVSKTLDGKKIISSLSTGIYANRIIGLAGNNGCGKSTLLKLMAGIWEADEGEIVRYADSISYLLPGDIFYDWMRVKDALQFYGTHYQRFRLEKARSLLWDAGIDQKTLLRKLSDGQRERVMLILALCLEAQLYLLDEPVSGSDTAFKKEIRQFLLQHLPEGATVIMATHLLRDFEQLFDEVLFLGNNGLIQKDTEQLREICGMSVERYYLEVVRHGS